MSGTPVFKRTMRIVSTQVPSNTVRTFLSAISSGVLKAIGSRPTEANKATPASPANTESPTLSVTAVAFNHAGTAFSSPRGSKNSRELDSSPTSSFAPTPIGSSPLQKSPVLTPVAPPARASSKTTAQSNRLFDTMITSATESFSLKQIEMPSTIRGVLIDTLEAASSAEFVVVCRVESHDFIEGDSLLSSSPTQKRLRASDAKFAGEKAFMFYRTTTDNHLPWFADTTSHYSVILPRSRNTATEKQHKDNSIHNGKPSYIRCLDTAAGTEELASDVSKISGADGETHYHLACLATMTKFDKASNQIRCVDEEAGKRLALSYLIHHTQALLKSAQAISILLAKEAPIPGIKEPSRALTVVADKMLSHFEELVTFFVRENLPTINSKRIFISDLLPLLSDEDREKYYRQVKMIQALKPESLYETLKKFESEARPITPRLSTLIRDGHKGGSTPGGTTPPSSSSSELGII